MKTIKINFKDLPDNTPTPVLTYCRKLIANGEKFGTRLEVYRENDEPDIICPKIGKAAKLGVSEVPYTHFIKYNPPEHFKGGARPHKAGH